MVPSFAALQLLLAATNARGSISQTCSLLEPSYPPLTSLAAEPKPPLAKLGFLVLSATESALRDTWANGLQQIGKDPKWDVPYFWAALEYGRN